MSEKKRTLGSGLQKIDAHVITPEEYEEIPELTEEWFQEADVYEGAKLIRRGHPPSDNAKKLVSLRLAREVLDHVKAAGPGWQTRINEVLLKSVRAKRAGAR
jgi:uncharacterized protein (DUF4415 family)